jgi:transcriptional antiterminator Rof (Rho-off)
MTPSSSRDPYLPLDCHVHDVLEAAATRGVRVHLVIEDDAGRRREEQVRILDVFARAGAEFLQTDEGTEIRLDRLLEVNGEPVRPGPSPRPTP